jgi:guanosine-3',5'-bis(diphosphate) 3'-pyrophosphohydrolase
MSDRYGRLFEAVAFAARAHRHQTRKDGVTPYASHAFRVGLVVRCVFGVDDPDVITAAVLHDTVEDTTTDYDELAELVGPRVAGWVAVLSKDKRLPEDERERRYAAGIAAGGWQVQVLKLADIYDNLLDAGRQGADKARTRRRSRFYLDALRPSLADEARPAFDIVRRLMRAGRVKDR